jgi:uncharacterized protein (DUF2235 family)
LPFNGYSSLHATQTVNAKYEVCATRREREVKRIVFCFDGTWNRLSADTPTNVVLTAASIVRQTPDATQIIHYDEGVGTGPFEKLPGGAAT